MQAKIFIYADDKGYDAAGARRNNGIICLSLNKLTRKIVNI